MGSLGGEFGKKAMWLYPMISGFIPPERWGHSACFSNGLVYIYGGCCGGIHFSDVLVLNLSTMSWTTLTTKGEGPGPRDSHSVALWGKKMLIFGGTNGSNKLNDLHVLDLVSNEWTQPICKGNPPCPRESHTSTLIGEDKLVIFGGSGEGIGNYLNDLHVLDLKSMAWSSMKDRLKGESPSPRDSHAATAVGDEVFVFGGDSGDRYHGDVHRLDMKTMTWMKLPVEGSPPGARAGHVVVSIGHKIYVVGGVGNNKYYNDAWSLDIETCSWSKLDFCVPSPQGRFSHSAVAAGFDIVVYGGCGEDERPLREIIVLRLQNRLPSNRILEKKRSVQRYENLKAMLLGNVIETDSKRRRCENSKKTSNTNQSSSEEHSASVSQRSSPSQYDQEETAVKTPPKSLPPQAFPLLNQLSQSPTSNEKPDPFCRQLSLPSADERSSFQERPHPSMIGAEVQGKVDGAFDSGYLMTAYINGRVFRGVLFAPVPGIVHRRGGAPHQSLTPMKNVADSETGFGPGLSTPGLQPLKMTGSVSGGGWIGRAETGQPLWTQGEAATGRSELVDDGVVLSLGVPGNRR